MFVSLVEIWSKKYYTYWIIWNEHFLNNGRGIQLFKYKLWHNYYARMFYNLFLKQCWPNIFHSYLRNMSLINFRNT